MSSALDEQKQSSACAARPPAATSRTLCVYRLSCALAICMLLACDVVSKCWIRATLPLSHRVPFLPGLVELLHVENTGAAFSIGQGGGPLFIGIAIVIALGICYYLFSRKRDLSISCALILICAGALGNAIDRILVGTVCDFFSFEFFSFPVFNVADIYITLAECMLLIMLFSRPWSFRSARGHEHSHAQTSKPKARTS